jgi:DNA-binding IclR family transcriptional regulator
VHDGLRVVRDPLSQARICEQVGASEAMVNRLLQDLVRGGYAEVLRERIVLLRRLPARWQARARPGPLSEVDAAHRDTWPPGDAHWTPPCA